METISKEVRLLVTNKLDSYEQFSKFKNKNLEMLNDIQSKKEKLWLIHKKSTNLEEKFRIKNEIDILSEKTKKYREIKKLCIGIEERIPIIESQIKEYEEQEYNKKKDGVSIGEHIK